MTFVAHRIRSGELAEDPAYWREIGAFSSMEAAMRACDDDAARQPCLRAFNWMPHPGGIGEHRSLPHQGIGYRISRRA